MIINYSEMSTNIPFVEELYFFSDRVGEIYCDKFVYDDKGKLYGSATKFTPKQLINYKK